MNRKKEPRIRSLAPVDPRQRYSLDEAAAYLRQSRAKIYLDIENGALMTFKDGARRYVPGSEIIRRSTIVAA